MAPIIAAQGLTKRYGPFLAVDHIDFEIRSGECFGFLGPNGAGKTTTIRMISCTSPVTEGRLDVVGLQAGRHDREIKGNLGVVPQDNNLDADLTVLDNLITYARYFDIPGRVARERALELLELFQLKDRLKSRVDDLSGGMQRRLVIARALINEPKVVILDEPTTGLDPQARHLVWQKLRLLRRRGTTMVLTTHYMDEAAQLCDRLVIMNQGRIIASGPPGELVRQHAGEAVLELHSFDLDEDEVRARLDLDHVTVESAGDTIFVYSRNGGDLRRSLDRLGTAASYRPATLEDVFLRLSGRSLAEE